MKESRVRFSGPHRIGEEQLRTLHNIVENRHNKWMQGLGQLVVTLVVVELVQGRNKIAELAQECAERDAINSLG
jgi:flagellar motor switch protein FliM